MPFLRPHDYTKNIDPEEWRRVKPDDQELQAIYDASLEDAQSYLRYRFDVAQVFFDVVAWEPNTSYSEKDVVSLEAEDWQSGIDYQTDDLAACKGKVYKATATVSAEEPDGSGSWDTMGLRDRFYVSQADGNTNPPNGADWEQKDPRVPNIRMYLTDLVIYHVFTNHVQPRAIPANRNDRYEAAMKFFKEVFDGKRSIPLPEAYPADDQADSTVRHGGNRKMTY